MKLIKVKQTFYDLCKQHGVDEELLFNENGRPCVLIVSLKYKEKDRNFIVPLRSNIAPNVPKDQYCSLPPNPKTKPHHHHGVHYIKLFPIHKKFVDKYVVAGDPYYTNILNILNRKESTIVQACQDYLDACANGNKHIMTPNIDGIIAVLDNLNSK